ncbi:LacI family transcriptional regulator [Butyrivibrio sp. CB08]|uniref:LacI family DNA-binding transcriptional regulator n=1 Tax=Butyrivibrio sp. CB08 TaxID=2364879 RepID=UPI000EAA6016|nr:LacI family DNA-binding transcriptional regulator [Butyrivibrio sp. CB08]RKM59874.1 LacI family transcriptional regulator [Butyrivibrio sp. CB08]
MPATIIDIKERTGLSLATISKYLNGGNVLPENRVKIEAAIKELNYEVNEIARGLVTKKTRTIGIMVHSVDSPFCGQLLHFLSEILRRHGYGILICDSNNDEEQEEQNVKHLLGRKVDGIIVIPVSETAAFLDCTRKRNVPVVLLDRALTDGSFDCVKIDNRAAVINAMDVLLRNNHKKIAIIASKKEYTGRERYEGFKQAMKKAGVKVNKQYVCLGSHSLAWGYENMKKLLALRERPTAVFTDNYEITLGAMMAVNESGLKCPEDISILGFDDQIIFHLINPPVYMVEQPLQEMSEKAVEMLLGRIDSGSLDQPKEISLDTRLIEGSSVKSLP